MAVRNVVKISELEGHRRLDAEYYHPKYPAMLDALHKIGAVPLSTVATPAKRKFTPRASQPFSYIEISEVDTSTGAINAVGLPGGEAPDRAQWIVRKGDVIVSTVRPNRNAVSLITDHEDGFVCSSGFAVLRAATVAPHYLFVFLKARPIVELLDRQTTATMYPAISWQDILAIPVLKPDRQLEQSITEMVVQTQLYLEQSRSLYLQAERMMIDRLGFARLELSQPTWWIASRSYALDVRRLDAEYYQPKYQQILKRILDEPCAPLANVAMTIRSGKTPAADEYSVEGVPILKVQGLRDTALIEECDAYVPVSWAQANAKAAVRQGDAFMLCAAHHPSYIGKTGLLIKDLGPLARAVGELIILRFNDSVFAQFACVYLNLPPVRLAVQRLTRGNTAHLYSGDLSSMPVPLLPSQFQRQVADLVHQSHNAREMAKALLNEAKAKVETLIESAFTAT